MLWHSAGAVIQKMRLERNRTAELVQAVRLEELVAPRIREILVHLVIILVATAAQQVLTGMMRVADRLEVAQRELVASRLAVAVIHLVLVAEIILVILVLLLAVRNLKKNIFLLKS